MADNTVDLARGERIRFLREKILGLKNQEELADKLGISRGAVGNWEQGKPIGVKSAKALFELTGASIEWIYSNKGPAPVAASEDRPLPIAPLGFPPTSTAQVPVMGRIGAGAEILPEFEQVPPEGLDTVEVPFALPGEMAAFEVKGESMLPRYDDGDVIVVWRDQRRATDSFLGEEVAVRTRDGRRYLKRLQRGQSGYNLLSWNANPIENVALEWVGEIYITVRGSQIRRAWARR